jgi:hypothetical protein
MAITANAIWETWPTSGSDTNGGGFDPSLTTNMDATLSATGGTTSAPVVTSSNYSFASGDVNAWLFIASGTNWTPGWYQITSVSAGAATINATSGQYILYNGATVQGTATGCATTSTPSSGTWAIDYSQQATAAVALTGESSAAAVVTTTSGAVSVAMVGNACYISGTGVTTQRRFIIQYNTSLTFTLDTSIGTGSALVVNVGGALNTINQAFGTTGGVGSNLFWLKNTGVAAYTITPTSPPAGVSGALTCLVGYNSLRGDQDAATSSTNMPVVQVNATASGQTCLYVSNAFCCVRNISTNAGTGSIKAAYGFYLGTTSVNGKIFAVNCYASGLTAAGFCVTGYYNSIINCYATLCTSAALGGFLISGGICSIIGCSSIANACHGFNLNSAGVGYSNFLGCVSAGNTGTSHGFYIQDSDITASPTGCIIKNCVSYNNGGDGLQFTGSGSADWSTIQNNIFASNGGYGINSVTTNYTAFNKAYSVFADYNAFYNNTAPRNNFPTGLHDVILTGNPFNLSTSTDFSLNSTAGAGAACRSAGFPGTLSGMSSTGYEDIGAIRHKDPSSAVINRITNIIVSQDPTEGVTDAA